MRKANYWLRIISGAVLCGFLLVIAEPAVVYADDAIPVEEPGEPTEASAPVSEETSTPAVEQVEPDEEILEEDLSTDCEAGQSGEAEQTGEVETTSETQQTGEDLSVMEESEQIPVDGDEQSTTEPETSIAAALVELPEDTEILVLDEEGDELPLASEEALDAISESDPIWCPNGVLPGGAGCTEAVSTITELLPLLAEKSGAGTIYFTTTYDVNDILLDQVANQNLANLTSITLQGGWNGDLIAPSILDEDGDPERTEFSVPITIKWNSDITLNNLYVTLPLDLRTTTTAVTIVQNNDSADVVLNKVAGELANNGVYIEGGHDVTIQGNSSFESNTNRGIEVRSVSGTFTLKDSESSANGEAGLVVQTAKNVLIDDSDVYGNNQTRADMFAGHLPNTIFDAENITITNSGFTGNKMQGLVVQYGDYGLWNFNTSRNHILDTLMINGSRFSDNTNDGLVVESWYEDDGEYYHSGILDINSLNTLYGQLNSKFSFNGENGLHAMGLDKVDINGAEFSSNFIGINTFLIGEVNVADTSFTDNSGTGAFLQNISSINFNGTSDNPITLQNNVSYGISLINTLGIDDPDFAAFVNLKYLQVAGSEFGIDLAGFTDATISNITSSGNSGYGLRVIPEVAGNVVISDSVFNDNDYGVMISTRADVDVRFEENTAESNSVGVGIMTAGDVDFLCSTVEGNDELDIGIETIGNINLKGTNPIDEDYEGSAYLIYRGDYTYLGECTTSTCSATAGTSASSPNTGYTVQVNGGEDIGLNCDIPWTALQLSNLNKATFSGICGANISANLNGVGESELPAALPGGMTLVSSLMTAVNVADSVLPDGAFIKITFEIPEDMQGSELSILYWDEGAGTWIEIPLFGENGFSPSNAAMQVLAGMTVNADGTVSATVNFTGTFVLVEK